GDGREWTDAGGRRGEAGRRGGGRRAGGGRTCAEIGPRVEDDPSLARPEWASQDRQNQHALKYAGSHGRSPCLPDVKGPRATPPLGESFLRGSRSGPISGGD